MNGIQGFSEERQLAGQKWLRGFLSRHPQITLKKAHNLSIAHTMGANPTVIGSWFTLLDKIKKTAGITSPDQIWSGDEMGVQNVPKEVKILGLKNIRCFQQVSAEQGETSTILSFIRRVTNRKRVFMSFWMTSDENFKIIQKIEAENAKKEEIQKEKENIKKEAVAKA